MDDEDDVFLRALNKRDSSTMCSESQFEEVMNFCEETAQTKQPYAAVDNSPVLTYEEIEDAFDESLDAPAKVFSREIYEHWKSRRLKVGNKSLATNLKVSCHFLSLRHLADVVRSSRQEQKRTTPIRMSALGDEKFVKCAKPVVGMRIARRSSRSFGRSWRRRAKSCP